MSDSKVVHTLCQLVQCRLVVVHVPMTDGGLELQLEYCCGYEVVSGTV